MMKLSKSILLPYLLSSPYLSSLQEVSASLVQCTKSKNGGDILLYGNSDWIGGWMEVYADTTRRSLSLRGDGDRNLVVQAGATFNLMFEMDCDACVVGPSCRTFDFDLMQSTAGDAVAVAEHSFAGLSIEYDHYSSSAIDHSIYRMDPIGPIPAGQYTYCVTSYVTDGNNEVQMEASMCGTLTSLMDVDPPAFSLPISVSPATTVEPGTSVTLTMQVADDAVLDSLNVNVNGEYYQRIGLKTQGNKVAPSLNSPRSVSVTYDIPSKGKVEPCDFNLRLCDLTNKCVEQDVTVDVVKQNGGPKN